jgi:hypothetical protein
MAAHLSAPTGALGPNRLLTLARAAQTANEFDMAGHAAKAKELLDQANNELKQAAEAANAAK